MTYVPVTIVAGYEGKVTKTGLRKALRDNPDGVIFKVESAFHGDGDRITGHHALNRDWTLEVHENSESRALVTFGTAVDNSLTAVVS